MSRSHATQKTDVRTLQVQSAAQFETLELRQFLSAAGNSFSIEPALTVLSASAAQASGIQGYSPSQIRHAYGFDLVSGDGAGQTIAIVDAYNDPNIAADLQKFDQAFSLNDPPSFKVVSQTGGSVSSIHNNSGWASEIALDVQWAHAIAPKANILLVETRSDTFSDLLTGVDYARHAAGVSVVSMSWGGNEFAGQTQYDKLVTTPAGHTGVTFVAASGDSGSWWGPQWPASSPNVLAVGGTSLLTSNSSGAYGAEYGWSGSGGGISYYESEPSYQARVQNTGGRTTPDVSFNANPYTGFAVYSSVNDGGIVGWSVVGGTSAAAPQWGALIAIANQARADAGRGTLDGANATIPTLYSLATASAGSYGSSFHDVTIGRSSYYLGSHPGYDGVTGLGSPKVPTVIAALAGSNSSASAVANHKAGTTSRLSAKLVRATSAPQALPVLQVSPPVALSTIHAATVGGIDSILGGLFNDGAAARVGLSGIHAATQVISVGSLMNFAGQALQHVTVWPADGSAAVSAAPAATSKVNEAVNGAAIDGVSAGADVTGVQPAAESAIRAIQALAGAGQMNAATTFADALASFAHESAALGSVVGVVPQTHRDAWATTFTVLAVDAILIAQWRLGRRKATETTIHPPLPGQGDSPFHG